jgi:hypothetical protein
MNQTIPSIIIFLHYEPSECNAQLSIFGLVGRSRGTCFLWHKYDRYEPPGPVRIGIRYVTRVTRVGDILMDYY